MFEAAIAPPDETAIAAMKPLNAKYARIVSSPLARRFAPLKSHAQRTRKIYAKIIISR
jgi:hypothetical protein